MSSMDVKKMLEKFGDAGQYAIPALVGCHALLQGHMVEALSMAAFGYMQKVEVFKLKEWFPRDRPEPYVRGQNSREDTESFPSSHTGGAFLGVGLAFALYGAKHPLFITSVASAVLVGLSRYLNKKHWATDVLAGALIGVANGILAAKCSSLIEKIKLT